MTTDLIGENLHSRFQTNGCYLHVRWLCNFHGNHCCLLKLTQIEDTTTRMIAVTNKNNVFTGNEDPKLLVDEHILLLWRFKCNF